MRAKLVPEQQLDSGKFKTTSGCDCVFLCNLGVVAQKLAQ